MFTNIHHIAIICSNYKISKRFYTEILGFKIINETFREERQSYKLDLEVNNQTQIELFSFPNPPKRITNPEAVGLRHLAFGVKDIKQVRDYLTSHSIILEELRIDEITGKTFFFFYDPDNLPLEVYSLE